MEWIFHTWPWWFSGTLIAVIMVVLLFFGESFGFSSNLRTLCAACGGGKVSPLFDFNWKSQTWNAMFLVGTMIGGWVSKEFLTHGDIIPLSQQTISDLQALGFAAPTGPQPHELFDWSQLLTAKGLLVLVGGGFLVGFGSRWAGGCTSGHAISGLSDLQLPSLIAVIGFFIGGLVMTFLFYPLIFHP
jgi:uncharacterized membrane protein YedE/YeeE